METVAAFAIIIGVLGAAGAIVWLSTRSNPAYLRQSESRDWDW